VSALKTLFRTTAFRLMVANLGVFLLFGFLLLGWMAYDVQRLVTSQIRDAVETEVEGLNEQFRAGGLQRLVFIIDRRSRQPGSSVYALVGFNGEPITGNVEHIPPKTFDAEGWIDVPYDPLGEHEDRFPHRALVRSYRLPGGFKLIVGRDLRESLRVRMVFERGARIGLGLALFLGLVGAAFVTRRVLKRVDAIGKSSEVIMAGDLTSRLPVAGTDDEIDRLAGSVNAMLDRIEQLMNGVKQVSDNIAHDLKTPLTRLRNRADEAFRTAHNEEGYKDALEKIMEESDALIRTFDALLLITRVEAGGQAITFTRIDLKPLLEGLVELYEPSAEDENMVLKLDAPASLAIDAHGDLLNQTLSNLIDNALKYGRGADGNGEITVSLKEQYGFAIIAVSDHGPGIAESDRGRALERFVRLDTSRTRPGSGLGLSLASAILRLHHGSITLEDNAPGLRVVLRVPKDATIAAQGLRGRDDIGQQGATGTHSAAWPQGRRDHWRRLRKERRRMRKPWRNP
jgi:signal transduction histidine kinase